ncbi:MAG: acetate/propionate family kinase [Janthinobacterium lividum]
MILGENSILVLNSGSSSLKIGLFGPGESDEQPLLEGGAEGIGHAGGHLHLRTADGTVLFDKQQAIPSQDEALQEIAAALTQHMAAAPIAVGHRVVHGGPHLREHQRITPAVLSQLEASVHFAPLHIPEAVSLIRKAEQAFPQSPQFACFDTTFHRTMPDVAAHLPLPGRYFAEGVQRYGFHGLSCESVMHRLGEHPPAKTVIAHLGGGSSVTAVQDGRSIDTSMGLSPTGGVPMSTRSGDLDPGVLLYLLRTEKLTADTLEQFVNHACGLTGLSNGAGDMQILLQRAAAGDAAASLAVDVFITAVRKAIGAYAALMGGLDLLVFTGGIGEHSEIVRNSISENLGFLGLQADGSGTAKMLNLPAEEEIQIARHCRRLLAAKGPETH